MHYTKRETALSRRPVHGPSAKQMQMDMEHGLACVGIRVHDQPEAFFCNALAVRDLRGYVKEMSDEGMVSFCNIQGCRNMLLRYDNKAFVGSSLET